MCNSGTRGRLGNGGIEKKKRRQLGLEFPPFVPGPAPHNTYKRSLTILVVVHDSDFRPIQEIDQVPVRPAELSARREHVRDEMPSGQVHCAAVRYGQQ